MLRRIVYSLKGRDTDKCLVVVGTNGGKLLVCDGKERPLERPKLKNVKHLRLTNDYLPQGSLKTNKSLKKALYIYKATSKEKS